MVTSAGISFGVPQQPTSPATPAQPAAGASESYRLAPGDEVEIRFFYNPELNDRAPIRPDGRLSIPLMGELNIAGLTVAELTARLKDFFKSQLQKPELTVQVRGFTNQRIFVGGEVARAGVLPLVGTKTILEAIIESGGFKESSQRSSVLLIRRDASGNPSKMQVSLNDNATGPRASSTFLQPYDVVLVSESGISKADRVVDQYLRRMIPVLLTSGFTYLAGTGSAFVPH
jgi:polysaccharide export outer membrane protein